MNTNQGTYSDLIGKEQITLFFDKPKRYGNSSVGFKILDSVNDVHFDTSTLTYTNKITEFSDSSITSYTTQVLSSNSAYAYSIAQILLTRDIINTLPITSSNSSIINSFRGYTHIHKNLVKNSESYSGSPWIHSSRFNVQDNFVLGPNGSSSATKISALSSVTANNSTFLNQTILTGPAGFLANKTFAYSLWLSGDMTWINNTYRLATSPSFSTIINIPKINYTTWTKVAVTGSVLSNNTDTSLVFNNRDDSNQGEFYVWGIQVEENDQVTNYQKTDENGNPLLDSDIVNDHSLSLGQIGIIEIDRTLYGDSLKPETVTAITNNNTMFKDNGKISDIHGILVKTNTSDTSWINSISAGFIFYDAGILSIHGDSLSSINSITSLSSVNYSAQVSINTLNVFCTSNINELNYPSNESSFYNNYVLNDPNLNSSTSNYDFSSSGWNWGIESTSSTHSLYYLRGIQNRNSYITTVGLYNDDNELLLVAKLSQPIIKSRFLPMTFRISYDF